MRRTRPAFAWNVAPEDRKRLARLGFDALTLAVTAVVFLVLNKPFFSNYSGYDEEYFTWEGWCIVKGLVPYRDFLDFKPPMVFFTHALALALFGLKHFGFRTFFALAPLASVLWLQAALLRRGVERCFALAVVVGFLCLLENPLYHDTALSDSESIVVLYYTLGLAAFLWQGRRPALTTALGGFFMSCSVLSKEPVAGCVIATWCGMFWLSGKASRAQARRFAGHSLVGVAAFVALLCVYMVPTGALAEYLRMIRRYPLIFNDAIASYCVALGVAHQNDGFAVEWRHVHAVFFNVRTLGYLAPIALPGAFFALRRSLGLFASMVVGLAAALWAAVATNCMWLHYCVMSMTGVLYVLVVAADSLRVPLAGAKRWLRVTVTGVVLLASAWALAPSFVLNLVADYVRVPWQEPMPGLMRFIASHTTPSDRIFTTGTPALYAQSDRVSAVRESAILDELLASYPGATDEERLRPIRDELVKNRPKVVFLDPEHESRKGRHLAALVIPFLRDYHYVAVNARVFLRP